MADDHELNISIVREPLIGVSKTRLAYNSKNNKTRNLKVKTNSGPVVGNIAQTCQHSFFKVNFKYIQFSSIIYLVSHYRTHTGFIYNKRNNTHKYNLLVY